MLLPVGAAITLWLAPAFAAAVYVFRPSPPGAIAVGLVLAAGVARLSARPMADTIAPAMRRPWLAVVVALAAVAAVAQIAMISVYVADPARVGWSYFPSDPFRVRHSCMTAYVEALRFCGQPGLLGGWAAIALLCAAHASIPSPGTVPGLGHLVTGELLTFVPIAAAVFVVARACREPVPVRAAVPSGALW